LTPITVTAAFATEVIPEIEAQLAVNQLITVTFPDGATLVFWGWLEEFTIASMKEGEQPTATVKFNPGNIDSDGVEVAPVYSDSPELSSGGV
jgi:hypothetical protein